MLAAVSAGAVDQTALLPRTRIWHGALLTPPEETLRERETNGSPLACTFAVNITLPRLIIVIPIFIHICQKLSRDMTVSVVVVPCIPHRWWPRNESLMIYLHRSYREYSQSELQAERQKKQHFQDLEVFEQRTQWTQLQYCDVKCHEQHWDMMGQSPDLNGSRMYFTRWLICINLNLYD